MPNWAGSSWYYLAYPLADKLKAQSSKLKAQKLEIDKRDIFSKCNKELKYFLPVDWYNGGLEHTTLHLLYSRFWHKFLFDLGVVPVSEPYAKRTSHGVVLGPDGAKMSKSKGNVINPDKVVEKFGADAFRVYEMFMGPFDETVAWSDKSLAGVRRFLDRIWRLYAGYGLWAISNGSKDKNTDMQAKKNTSHISRDSLLTRKLHHTIKKVTEDLEELKFNTAIASLMEYINEVYREKLELGGGKWEPLTSQDAEIFLRLLAPFAPHLAEELYQRFTIQDLRFTNEKFRSVHLQTWPEYDPKLVEEETVEFVVQINGKVRDRIKVESAKWKAQNYMEKKARESVKVRKYIDGKKVKKTIFIPGKLINFVTD
jgi:leucyl-tRNA synthetase